MVDRTWTGRILLKGERKGVGKAMRATESGIGQIAMRLKALAPFAVAAGIGAVFITSAQKIKVFEKSISDLSAITGATGKDLDQLTEASKRIGKTTTLSASQAAEAFKLMASAKPDLLSNLDALEQTTLASVTLAEAAGLELPEATRALGESLNQFGAGAESAAKFINVLAAGAKLGSSEINDTSEALKNVGVVAKLAKLSFEETNAAIQGLAAAGIKGSDAGTKLRSVLIKLQTQADDNLNPAVVGINAALENLAAKNLSVTERTKIFGERQIATADILVDQRELIARLSEELEGTNEAYLQAARRTDNLDGDMKRLNSVIEAVQLNIGNALLPTLRALIQTFTDIFGAISAMSGSEGIQKADEQFSIFEATIKTLFVTGNIVKNLFDIIGETFKGIGRIIGAVMSGSLANVQEAINEFGEGVTAQVDDIAEFAFRTFNATAAAELDNANKMWQPIIASNTKDAVDAGIQAGLTAGQEAAAAAAEKARKAQQKLEQKEAERLERLRLSFRTERQVIDEEFQLKLQQQNELQEAGILIDQAFIDSRLELARQFQADLTALELEGMTDRQKFEQKSSSERTKFVLGEAIKLTQGVAQHSKTLFKINKIAAIANAVMNTSEAITTTLKAYPYPINVALAALTAAAGFAQIAAIKSTSFGGGGTGTTPSAAGSVPVINNQPLVGVGGPPIVPGVGVGGPTQFININISGLDEGGLIETNTVRKLIESINDQLGDGVNLDVEGG
jgi:TP901 family phage tail tape measure protein